MRTPWEPQSNKANFCFEEWYYLIHWYMQQVDDNLRCLLSKYQAGCTLSHCLGSLVKVNVTSVIWQQSKSVEKTTEWNGDGSPPLRQKQIPFLFYHLRKHHTNLCHQNKAFILTGYINQCELWWSEPSLMTTLMAALCSSTVSLDFCHMLARFTPETTQDAKRNNKKFVVMSLQNASTIQVW